jgi:hypothetical protein
MTLDLTEEEWRVLACLASVGVDALLGREPHPQMMDYLEGTPEAVRLSLRDKVIMPAAAMFTVGNA